MHILHPEYYKKPFFHFNRHRETKIHASPTLTTKKVTPLLTHSSPQREKRKDRSTNRFDQVEIERGTIRRRERREAQGAPLYGMKGCTRLYANRARWSSEQWRVMEKARRTEPLVTRNPFVQVVRFFGSSYVYFEYSPADRYRARSTSNRD